MDRTTPGFDFFGLPRELRDYIYDELPTTTKRIRLHEFQKSNLWVIGHELPITNFLLVSDQFGDEYRERKHRIQRLAIEDHLQDPADDIEIKLPPRIRAFPALDFFLYVGCDGAAAHNDQNDPHCSIPADLAAHRRRVDAWAAQMNRLRSLTVSLYLEPPESPDECGRTFLKHQEEIIEMEGLQSLEVHRIDFDGFDGTDEWDYSRSVGPVVKWMPGMERMENLAAKPVVEEVS